MKKRIALLSGLLLVSIVGQLLLRPCLGNETKDGEQIFSSEQDNTSELMGTKDLFEAEQEEEDFKSGDLQSDLYKQLAKMIAFVAIIGAGVWFYCKKFSGRWNPAKGKNIIITETVNLGPRKHLHIVQLGAKQYLLSSTPDSIRLLVDVTESLEHGDD
ncbi:MAG: flagellar biosynthetic protein FliO [Planctomycetota bacterium]|jgi:flagellar biogenesis protein FliO